MAQPGARIDGEASGGSAGCGISSAADTGGAHFVEGDFLRLGVIL